MEQKQNREDNPEQIHEDVDMLIDWAEDEEDTVGQPYRLPEDEEPCESDMVDDRVGLPGGTLENANKLADAVDE